MNGVISYSGIATKTRAMSSRLLTREELNDLASHRSVASAVSYLKQDTAYAGVLAGIVENDMHRGIIEELLIRSLYQDYSKIYYFCNLKQRAVLELYFCKYEIQILKMELRRIFNSREGGMGAVQRSEEFRSFSRLDLDGMNEARNIPQLMEALRKTAYYDVFRQLGRGGGKTLFDYEMALDLFYFSNIWKKKDKVLKGKDLKMFTQVYGSQIDMLNMMWIYRAKHYYQIPPAGIFALIIPVSYKLRRTQLINLVNAENERELDAAIRETYYGHRYRDLKEEDLERLFRQLIREIYHVEKRKNPYSMTAITSYLFEKEQEIDQITTILECIRYGVAPTEASKYIL